MCRHIAYLGAPVTLAELLVDPAHSLMRQSWAPKEMRGGGTINVDGFGAGWYADSGVRRYRRACPIWTDQNFLDLAKDTTATAVLAAVRSATAGMGHSDSACAPFSGDGWLFSHNGFVASWPDSVTGLAAGLPMRELLTLDAPTDAALMWAVVRRQLRDGVDPAKALAATVADVRAVAPGSRLNFLLTDGRMIVATTAGHTLAIHHTPGRVVVASEPCDDNPGWTRLEDNRLVVADLMTYRVEDL
jgi:glutamine amidotransferase